jgi:hypothetical protein
MGRVPIDARLTPIASAAKATRIPEEPRINSLIVVIVIVMFQRLMGLFGSCRHIEVGWRKGDVARGAHRLCVSDVSAR